MKTFKYIAAGLLVSGIFAVNSFASITVHNKLKDAVSIRTDGLMQADKDEKSVDMILRIQPKQKITFELWKNPYNQNRNIMADKLYAYIGMPGNPWQIKYLDGTISNSDYNGGNELKNYGSYTISFDTKKGYVLTEVARIQAVSDSEKAKNIKKMAEDLKLDPASMAVLKKNIVGNYDDQEYLEGVEEILSLLSEIASMPEPKLLTLDNEDMKTLMGSLIWSSVSTIKEILDNAKLLKLDAPAVKNLINNIYKASGEGTLENILSDLKNKLKTYKDVVDIPAAKPIGFKTTDSLQLQSMINNKNNLTPEARRTIEVLLKQVPARRNPAKYLTEKTWLHLENANIKDLSPFKYLKKLGNVILSGNQIEDISPLENLNIVAIKLDGNPIVDFKPLEKLPNLWTVILDEDQNKKMKEQKIVLPERVSIIS